MCGCHSRPPFNCYLTQLLTAPDLHQKRRNATREFKRKQSQKKSSIKPGSFFSPFLAAVEKKPTNQKRF